MADPTGFEPAISSVTGWHVWPLHHGSAERVARIAGAGSGVRGRSLIAVVLALLAAWLLVAPVSAADSDDPLAQYLALIDRVRVTLDATRDSYEAGDVQGAQFSASSAYLDSFELIEIPLRQRDPDMTLEMEDAFAILRADIRTRLPASTVTDDVARLQSGMNDVERTLSLEGSAPVVVTATAFVLVLRGGLEAILLLSSILAYLATARATRLRRPVFVGVGVAIAATIGTWFVLQAILLAAPIRPSLVQALPAVVAVVVLVGFSYWLLARLDQRRWLEFMSARVFTAVAAGSGTALFVLGFTAVYRQGFESVVFFQALLSYSRGLESSLAIGALAGLVAVGIATVVVFRLGRRVPLRSLLGLSVVLVMLISIALIGNAVRGLQEAYVVGITNLTGSLPRLPFYLAQATGYHPTLETIAAQIILAATYVATAAIVVMTARRRRWPAAVPLASDSAGAAG